ncbi:MAG: c-type cytochrome [Acetobacteraceae bacterium]|nr:c-type cytochrome [Acetobacteraceae bacterium]
MRLAALLSGLCLLAGAHAIAQMPVPEAPAPDPARLFRTQCATCHTLKASEPQRQGPTLEHVYGRKIGSVADYKYTPGYRESDQNWTAENLDRYLTNPQAMFPGSTMAYRQSKPETRKLIIDYLKEQG